MYNPTNFEISISITRLINALKVFYLNAKWHSVMNEMERSRMYCWEALGGKRNLLFLKAGRNEIFLFVREMARANPGKLKNFGAKVYVSHTRDCILLKPDYNSKTPKLYDVFRDGFLLDSHTENTKTKDVY